MTLMGAMQQQPPPQKELSMLRDAGNLLAGAMAGVQLRSSKGAKLIADAQSRLQSAIQTIQEEGSGPVAAPPDMGSLPGMPPYVGGF